MITLTTDKTAEQYIAEAKKAEKEGESPDYQADRYFHAAACCLDDSPGTAYKNFEMAQRLFLASLKSNERAPSSEQDNDKSIELKKRARLSRDLARVCLREAQANERSRIIEGLSKVRLKND